MLPRKDRHAVVVQKSSPTGSNAGALKEDPLFGVAMLKMALEIKRGVGSFDSVIQKVAKAMRLDEPALREYLGTQGALLRSLSRAR